MSLRLSVPVSRTVSGGPGITGAAFTTTDGDIAITRKDGRTATLAWPGRIDRRVALHRRDTAELLAEELRRLDPDEVYGETLGHIDASEPAALPAVDDLPAVGERHSAGELPSAGDLAGELGE